MRNLKFPTIFAAFGFALSLLFGFFSRSHFGFIFLRALIFALIFFALGFLINFIYKKFLDEDTSSDLDGEQLSSTEKHTDDGNFAKGQHVDLVVEDQELDSETSENHYVVGQNHQMLSDSDLKKSADRISEDMQKSFSSAVAASSAVKSSEEKNSTAEKPFVASTINSVSASAADSGQASGSASTFSAENKSSASKFVPLGKESFARVSSTEAMDSTQVRAEPKSDNFSDSLDVLPDMADLEVNDSSESSEDAETDDEFVSSAVNYKNSDSSETEVKDASLMAKAISSLLSAES